MQKLACQYFKTFPEEQNSYLYTILDTNHKSKEIKVKPIACTLVSILQVHCFAPTELPQSFEQTDPSELCFLCQPSLSRDSHNRTLISTQQKATTCLQLPTHSVLVKSYVGSLGEKTEGCSVAQDNSNVRGSHSQLSHLIAFVALRQLRHACNHTCFTTKTFFLFVNKEQ